MIRHVLICLRLLQACAHGPLTLGALGAWTRFEPDLIIALIAANLDFRKGFEAPVQDRLEKDWCQLTSSFNGTENVFSPLPEFNWPVSVFSLKCFVS